MLYRIKQFIKGIISFNFNDSKIVDRYLNHDEKMLFQRLPGYEKRHAIDTAKTIHKFCVDENRHILIKSALLHDIGKVDSGIGLIKKSILVLMDRFLPDISHRLAKNVNMFYVYYNHPKIGAELLDSIGTDKKVVQLVKLHQSEGHDEVYGLNMLKKADNLN